MESISSMKMIAGAFSRACLKRSRTRLAPTPTNNSTNSEALKEKNGTPASPATARARSVLPVPGAPTKSTPFGRPKAGVLLGVHEEVHDLDQLVLGLLDAGDVLEGDLRVLLLVVAPGAAPADAREGAAHAAALLLSAPIEPDVAPDQEQRRTEGEEERLPKATAFLYRLGADLDAVVDQEFLEPGSTKTEARW